MGIKSFWDIFERVVPFVVEFPPNADLANPQETSYTISFDLPMLIFSGCVRPNFNELTNEFDVNMCVAATWAAIHNVLLTPPFLDIAPKVKEIRFYDDHNAPERKHRTQEHRRRAQKNSELGAPYPRRLITDEVRRMLCGMGLYLTPTYSNDIRTSIMQGRGEAEFDMFNMRDATTTNILVTEDTDLFAITYNYTPVDERDRVFIYSRKRHTAFAVTQFSVLGLHRTSFQLLCSMLGTDYTPPILSPSMVKALLNTTHELRLSWPPVIKEAWDRLIAPDQTAVRVIEALEAGLAAAQEAYGAAGGPSDQQERAPEIEAAALAVAAAHLSQDQKPVDMAQLLPKRNCTYWHTYVVAAFSDLLTVLLYCAGSVPRVHTMRLVQDVRESPMTANEMDRATAIYFKELSWLMAYYETAGVDYSTLPDYAYNQNLSFSHILPAILYRWQANLIERQLLVPIASPPDPIASVPDIRRWWHKLDATVRSRARAAGIRAATAHAGSEL